jgi:hypothetical protein
MARGLRARLNYANVMATIALFVALGGGAWAASSGLVSSSGLVQECVGSHGGVPRVVRAHARCPRHTLPLFLATPGATALRGLRGKTGPRGRTGRTGATGPTGPAGPQGPAAPGSYAFSLTSASGPEQAVAAKFAGSDEVRLVCGAGKCSAQVLVAGSVGVLGSDVRGAANATPKSTTLINPATPAQATLTEIDGTGGSFESKADATVSVAGGAAWQVDVELANDPSGNVHLIGTATPASATSQFPL